MSQSLEHMATKYIDAEIIYEKHIGSNFQNFKTLTNISKELIPLNTYTTEDIFNIWKSHRIYNFIQNKYCHTPILFDGFKEIIGFTHIKQCLNNGGIFATYHFGNYRYIPYYLTTLANINSLYISTDIDTYNQEKRLTIWKESKKIYPLKDILSEKIYFSTTFLKNMSLGESMLLCLDDIPTSHENYSIINIKHLSSIVKMKMNIFKLLYFSKRPMCILISDKNDEGLSRLTAYPPFYISQKDNIPHAANYSYHLFQEKLKAQPQLWNLWYKHHQYVTKWGEFPHQKLPPSIDLKITNGRLGLDISTGHIHRIS
ncbi:hypothetical protein [Bacillus wiedmannii]|uniref:hypothetical protein n=1 Tax=Bacillus wiedmannii TaxID=1890302 RepID=UPI000BF78DCF|nr:hypothetical protein [Bacillus wiedmannii]PGD97847.1 hypothetical protein COM48_07205 [Bacillus wiedmannii]PHG78297.1 hypothetical protein COI50_11100 [Bacillus wiedmannii]